MHPDKLEWVVAHSLCPACRRAPLTLQGDALTCGECGRRYPVAGGSIDFLDAETRSLFQLEDTENVSDHPFDGNAMTIIDRCREAGGMVLDCGSGYKSDSYPHVVQMEIVDYPNVDVLSVNQRLPFADDSFDAVFSLDVLEHVNDPFLSAGEICRVLRPGGYLYVDLPFLQSEHGYPNHFFNATRSGLRRLFTELDVLSHHVPYSGRAIHTMYFHADDVLRRTAAGREGAVLQAHRGRDREPLLRRMDRPPAGRTSGRGVAVGTCVQHPGAHEKAGCDRVR